MNNFFYILLMLIVLFAVLFIPIQIELKYKNKQKESQLVLDVKIFNCSLGRAFSTPLAKILSILARKRLDRGELQEVMKSKKLPEKNWKLIYKRLRFYVPNFKKIINKSLRQTSKLLRPVKCKKLKINSEIGLFDAAQTALAVGSTWSLLGLLVSRLSRWIYLLPEALDIKVNPNFQKTKIIIECDCIIVFPLGHIIIIIVQYLSFITLNSKAIKELKSVTETNLGGVII